MSEREKTKRERRWEEGQGKKEMVVEKKGKIVRVFVFVCLFEQEDYINE